MNKKRLLTGGMLAGILYLFFAAGTVRADDPPQWLRQVATVAASGYEKDIPGVVLFDEQQTTYDGEGKLKTVENYAVKVLTREGRGLAVARAYYLVSSGKVKDIKGWIVRPDGSVKEYDKKFVLDVIADTDDIYNEGRIKVIDASGDADAGYVFGYTIESEDSPLFYQDSWAFQHRLPTLVSRYSLTLPKGWTASSFTFNAAEVRPQVSGSSYVWEMRDLAAIPPEPMSPSTVNLSPRIVVNYAPENKQGMADRVFGAWSDVSQWATAMHEPQVIVDDNVAGKARELTANASSELDKIRAIGTYVQNLQYISIDIGVGYGNGYRPRSSATVLSRGYGDCKDKANLMRAMLKSLKIEAYPVAIYSGDPTFVREKWPSPRQFNHCIIAIKIGDAVRVPSILEHEKLGRLLIFDATDAYTPVGDLPDYLQGSFALIAAGDNGGLSKMPILSADSDMLERTIEATLSPVGEIKGSIRERSTGQTSAYSRRELRDASATEYRKGIEGWLTRGATGAKLGNLQTNDRFQESGFDMDLDFSAASYAQLMQDRLLVFKPVIVGRRNGISITDAKRKTPIMTDAWSMKETAVFTLPEGFVVDETPDPITLQTDFGSYSTKYEIKNGKLFFSRTLVMKRAQVPVEKYESVRSFYSKMRDAEQSPVVLVRK